MKGISDMEIRADFTYNPDEYKDSMKGLSKDLLKSEKESLEKELENQSAYLESNSNLVDQHCDDPGFEHLLEMSIIDCHDRQHVIIQLKSKIGILEELLSA